MNVLGVLSGDRSEACGPTVGRT